MEVRELDVLRSVLVELKELNANISLIQNLQAVIVTAEYEATKVCGFDRTDIDNRDKEDRGIDPNYNNDLPVDEIVFDEDALTEDEIDAVMKILSDTDSNIGVNWDSISDAISDVRGLRC